VIARLTKIAAALAAFTFPAIAYAQTSDAAVSGALDRAFGEMAGSGGEPLSLSLQLLLVMGLLTILPALLLMMTSFTGLSSCSPFCARPWGCSNRHPIRC